MESFSAHNFSALLQPWHMMRLSSSSLTVGWFAFKTAALRFFCGLAIGLLVGDVTGLFRTVGCLSPELKDLKLCFGLSSLDSTNDEVLGLTCGFDAPPRFFQDHLVRRAGDAAALLCTFAGAASLVPTLGGQSICSTSGG